MITRFKIFENINEGEPELGDWVIAYRVPWSPFRLYPGQIDPKETQLNFDIYYINFYDKESIITSFTLGREDIRYWSKNREDIEEVLIAQKYNV